MVWLCIQEEPFIGEDAENGTASKADLLAGGIGIPRETFYISFIDTETDPTATKTR